MIDLTDIATTMRRAVQLTGQPVEHALDAPDACRLILRPGPSKQMQLVTVMWCRQPSLALRAELRRAFDVPDDTRETLDYQKGWGIMKLTWSLGEPQQLDLLPDYAASAGGAAYQL